MAKGDFRMGMSNSRSNPPGPEDIDDRVTVIFTIDDGRPVAVTSIPPNRIRRILQRYPEGGQFDFVRVEYYAEEEELLDLFGE